ncbi:bacteriocin-protection protein [Paenibacillus selenitireducens]|uniref:Bacteriocin-protection protein n=1 Tax=Paenibacillus selenitireducens TaxID=1324314 RepID=A0A1T2XMZ1_9BACL|nr:YdeI/OmpD-associated family protein [Paenibacillus selenitireducens]OPA81227.1 bacteriocin-protection protein [Paenibacillus selenitireducens]
MVKKSVTYPVLHVSDQSAWEEWLEGNHKVSTGVRLQIAKKNAGGSSPSYEEALEVALCYGWIDSQKEACDEVYWIQRFSPRGPKSIWSQVNRDKAERLLSEGKMQAAGLEAVEAAKQDGRWEAAYAPQSKATIPEDLQAELNQNPKAKAFFETLNGTNRYAILFRLQSAKKPETRHKRLQQFVSMLERGEKIYP